jgi:hypothetical protein
MAQGKLGRYSQGEFEAVRPEALLVSLQKRWDVRRRNAQLLEILRRIRAPVASGDFPVRSDPMQHDRKIAFVGVGGAKRPIVRNRDMQDLPELFRHNLSHLLNILRIAKIPGDGRDNEAKKGDSGSQGNVSA